MKEPLVSIIIPVFNRPEYLSQAVNSVIGQSYANWECIIVDDKSTDDTFDVATQLAREDDRINVIKNNQKFKNASVCRNIGIEKSLGEYLIFLDSDDFLLEDCLRFRLDFIKNDPAKKFYVFANGYFVNQPGDLDRIRLVNSRYDTSLAQFLMGRYIWGIQSVLWNRQSIIEINGFDERFDRLQDVELHIRALCVFNNSYSISSNVDSLIRLKESRNNYKNIEFVKKMVGGYVNLFQIINSETLHNSIIEYNVKIIKKFTIGMFSHNRKVLMELSDEIYMVFYNFKKVYSTYIRVEFIQLIFKLYVFLGHFYGKRLIFKFIVRKVL